MAQFSTKSNLATVVDETGKKKNPPSGEEYIWYRKNIPLYEKHNYSLSNIDKDKGIFYLQNPHSDGNAGGERIEVNRDELNKYFSSIIIS